MIQEPKIPMSPDQLPQQRIHEVVDLPKRPHPFDFCVGYGSVPEYARGKGDPKSAAYSRWKKLYSVQVQALVVRPSATFHSEDKYSIS
jgi:hypothetical protein